VQASFAADCVVHLADGLVSSAVPEGGAELGLKALIILWCRQPSFLPLHDLRLDLGMLARLVFGM
jgi:hypothetical protein